MTSTTLGKRTYNDFSPKQSKNKVFNEANRKRDAKTDDQDRLDSGITRATEGDSSNILAMSAAGDNSKAAFENYPEIS
jgi:hypothetical protein